MTLSARLNRGETLGDRVIKVDHAGEHGAVCVYRAQRWISRWRSPELLSELDQFLEHEIGHRARFGTELERRHRPRCRSYYLCGLGGFLLGTMTGLAGREAVAATTVAIERVVLRHMREQIDALDGSDIEATVMLREIILDEQEHHDLSLARTSTNRFWSVAIEPIVMVSTEVVIWLGMRL